MTPSPVETLLVEDNPADLELTMHAFKATTSRTASTWSGRRGSD